MICQQLDDFMVDGKTQRAGRPNGNRLFQYSALFLFFYWFLVTVDSRSAQFFFDAK
jgi:hypothetical protein